jgi:hypothetical protein
MSTGRIAAPMKYGMGELTLPVLHQVAYVDLTYQAERLQRNRVKIDTVRHEH